MLQLVSSGNRCPSRSKLKYPDGYTWSCCGALGSERGCKNGPGDGIDELYATSQEPELDDEEFYHPGSLEVIDEEWPDHDERCHGRIDTKTNRTEYPEGFGWSCCGQQGTFSEGCTKRNEDEDSD